jgi:hypothetical protein
MKFCNVSTSRSSSVEVEVPRREEEDDQVATNKCSENAQVSPPVVERVAKRLVKLIADLVRAVLAHVGCLVKEVPRSTTFEVVGHVSSASLTFGCAEGVEFGRLAANGQAVEFGDDHATNQACEGVELVQPHTPEFGDLRLGNGDTTEESEDNDDLEKSVCVTAMHIRGYSQMGSRMRQ